MTQHDQCNAHGGEISQKDESTDLPYFNVWRGGLTCPTTLRWQTSVSSLAKSAISGRNSHVPLNISVGWAWGIKICRRSGPASNQGRPAGAVPTLHPPGAGRVSKTTVMVGLSLLEAEGNWKFQVEGHNMCFGPAAVQDAKPVDEMSSKTSSPQSPEARPLWALRQDSQQTKQ